MHTVQCAQCGRSLTIPKPVVQAKIRCPACGAVFVGTSQPAGEAPQAASRPSAGGAPAPRRPQAPRPPSPPRPERPDSPDDPAAQQPASPSSAAPQRPKAPAPTAATARPAITHYVPPKSNKGLYMGLLFGFFVLFIAGAAFVLIKYAGTTEVVVRDAYGNIVKSGRVTPEVAKKWQEEASQVPESNVVQLPPVPIKPKAVARGGARDGVNPSLTMSELNSMGQDANASTELPELPALPEDPKIAAMSFEKVLLPGSSDTGTIVGMVSNKYDEPLGDLVITPQIVDPKGRVVAKLAPFSCSNIPAGGTARYSVKYDGVPEESVEKIRIAAKVVPMEKGMVCYEIEDKPVLDPQDKIVTATGSARNMGLKSITDAFVYVDFYTREWIYIKSVRGTIIEDTGGRITAGRRARFKAELPVEDSEEAQRVQQALARVVGKEE
jgi:phage FluMu protein Com